jgi:hypothetical protein
MEDYVIMLKIHSKAKTKKIHQKTTICHSKNMLSVEYSFILTYEQFSHTFSELKLKKHVLINIMNFEVKFMTSVEISNDNSTQHNIQCGNLLVTQVYKR